jgi:hypothetical protein
MHSPLTLAAATRHVRWFLANVSPMNSSQQAEDHRPHFSGSRSPAPPHANASEGTSQKH